MAQFAFDGNVRVARVAEITNPAAPTVAELNGGLDLSEMLPKDGWQPSTNTNSVEAGKLSQTYDASVPGTWGGEVQATFFRDNNPSLDIAWYQFDYGDEGFLVIRYGLPYTTAWADGQPVEVWPYICNKPQMNATATNTNARFGLTFNIPTEPELFAIVGGGS